MEAYKAGYQNGITGESWEIIKDSKILLKSPLTTPQGEGYKSVNVTLRKSLNLYANVRPVKTYQPYVASKHDNVDMVIVRENEEDLYAGVEYQPSSNSCYSIKLITEVGCERICRYAFEYARSKNRKKVSLLIKDNIMKIADGMFHRVFDRVAKEYPEIENDTLIVDIGMARVADTPENFDVIVTQNLYGDIVSDIASQVSGSVGSAGSCNIGNDFAMFEAVHGSAPDIAGKGIANPSGLLNGAILMLHHIGQHETAEAIENAWLTTLENGQHTGDIAKDKSKALTTEQFADAVIANLGKTPKALKSTDTSKFKAMDIADVAAPKPACQKQVGVDVFLNWHGERIADLGQSVEGLSSGSLKFKSMGSRGLKVYPSESAGLSNGADLFRCRFVSDSSEDVSKLEVRKLLQNIESLGLNWVKVENLYELDGKKSFSQMQGEG